MPRTPSAVKRKRRPSPDEELQAEIDRIDRGENAWIGTEAVEGFEVKQPLDKVVPVRLNAIQWDALYAEARELGIGPSTLMRMWTLEKLRAIRRRRRRPA